VFPHVRREIEHFFEIYKELEGKKTQMKGWKGPKEARHAVVESRDRYLQMKAAQKSGASPA
jgi:inorganic pyrophosphatase